MSGLGSPPGADAGAEARAEARFGGRARRSPSVDVLVVSLGATGGLRAADRELCDSIERAGATVSLVTARRPREVRTLMLTDLMWAMSARKAAKAAIARHSPRAIVYSSVTAALMWPRHGAIRFDALAAGNREGRHGLWQRPLERRRLSESRLLLPWSELALGEAVALPASARKRVVSLPVPVEPSRSRSVGAAPLDPAHDGSPSDGDRGEARDIAAITYAANPAKKGLDTVLAAWSEARLEGETLLVAGTTDQELRRAGISLPSSGVKLVGMLPSAEYRALLRRAQVFVSAPRREDHGIAQLEALVDGCVLVTSAAPGPYVALPIANGLDPRLVGDDLSSAIRTALDEPRPDYAARAGEALRSLRRVEVDRVVREQVLPKLIVA